MILHPAIIALCSSSLLTSAILLYAAFFAVRILRRWDLSSGSELQVALEHRTYLISTIMACSMIFQLLSLFLFIHTADGLSTLFKGAMCAAGTLNLNAFGYPALLLKLGTFLLAGLWLVINRIDNRGYDYPLIRIKYLLLLIITPLVLVESLVQGLYFFLMKPHVITSCCGSLFGTESKGLAPTLALIPEIPLLAALTAVVLFLLTVGAWHCRTGRSAALFSAASLAAFLCGAVALVSALPVYVYALPSHHCPFCMLQREYGYVGYLFYVTLLGGAVCGIGAGLLQRFSSIKSLSSSLPSFQRRLIVNAMLLFAIFLAVAFWQVYFSELRLT